MDKERRMQPICPYEKKNDEKKAKQQKKCAGDATNTISISGKYVYFYFHNASAAHVSF